MRTLIIHNFKCKMKKEDRYNLVVEMYAKVFFGLIWWSIGKATFKGKEHVQVEALSYQEVYEYCQESLLKMIKYKKNVRNANKEFKKLNK